VSFSIFLGSREPVIPFDLGGMLQASATTQVSRDLMKDRHLCSLFLIHAWYAQTRKYLVSIAPRIPAERVEAETQVPQYFSTQEKDPSIAQAGR